MFCGANGAASQRYCKQLKILIAEHAAEVGVYIGALSKLSGHGIRKGAAMCCTSACLFPPPLSSVAMRAEWSMGVVLDIYLRYSDAGDQYCGKDVLCGGVLSGTKCVAG